MTTPDTKQPESLSPLMRDTIEAMRAGTVYLSDWTGVIRLNASPSAPQPKCTTFEALERRGLVRRLTPREHGVPRPRWELTERLTESASEPQLSAEPVSGSPEAVEQAPRHTPGPWRVVEPDAIDYRAPMIYGRGLGSLVAVAQGGGPEIAITGSEARANAALIARAWEIPEWDEFREKLCEGLNLSDSSNNDGILREVAEIHQQRDELAERVRMLERDLSEVEPTRRWYIDQHETDGTRIAALEKTNRELADVLEFVRLWGLGQDCGGWPVVQDRVERALRSSGRLPAAAPLPVEGEPEAQS